MMTKQNISLFILTQKQKKLLMKMILMIYLNQYILRLYIQIYLGKGSDWTIDSVIDQIINI